ncbi:MAG: hypothetical protein WC455_25810 [Dehalococcoidia bacterium]
MSKWKHYDSRILTIEIDTTMICSMDEPWMRKPRPWKVLEANANNGRFLRGTIDDRRGK